MHNINIDKLLHGIHLYCKIEVNPCISYNMLISPALRHDNEAVNSILQITVRRRMLVESEGFWQGFKSIVKDSSFITLFINTMQPLCVVQIFFKQY